MTKTRKGIRVVGALWLYSLWTPMLWHYSTLTDKYGSGWSIFRLHWLDILIVIACALCPICTVIELGRLKDKEEK